MTICAWLVSSGKAFQQLTAIAASVGPYKLKSSACGNFFLNVLICAGNNGSPLHNTLFTLLHDPSGMFDKKISSIDGTKCKVVISLSSISCFNWLMSLCIPGWANTNFAPINSGQNNS